MKVVDMHCDTIAELYYDHRDGGNASILENHLHIDLKRMIKGDYLLQNFALFTHLGREQRPFEHTMKLLDTFYTEMEAHKDVIGIVKSWEDIEANRKAGRMSAMLTLEEGGVCQGEISFLRDFYRLGARMMTLTWNFENELAYPNRMEYVNKEGADRPPKCVPDTENGLKGDRVRAGDGTPRDDHRCFPLKRCGDLGCVSVYDEAVCGKPLQCKSPGIPSAESDRRDDKSLS